MVDKSKYVIVVKNVSGVESKSQKKKPTNRQINRLLEHYDFVEVTTIGREGSIVKRDTYELSK